MEEIWKPIVGYENIYSVSSFGSVRRELQAMGTHAGRIVKPYISSEGYFYVTLSINSKVKKFSVHSLVAMAFLGRRPEGFETNHKDAVRTNNSISNLEYISYQDNARHNGVTNGNSKLNEEDVQQIRKKYVFGIYGANRLAKEFSVAKPTILRVIKRKTWNHVI